MLTVRVHSAKVQAREGIKLLLELARDCLPSASPSSVDGRRLLWRGQGRGLGGEGTGVDGTDRAPSAEAGTRRSDEGMGERVGQGGVASEWKKLLPSKGSRSFLPRSAPSLG